jgi:predicted short-subunit dehydrogenase-like oxidoreductase (DUF2520 family)
MTTAPITTLSILGPGRVGRSLAARARQAGIAVTFGGRTAGDDIVDLATAATASSLVLLTVSDDAIESVCNQLTSNNALAAGTVVAHCSGVHDHRLLQSAADAGCLVASLHPLQTFPDGNSADRFEGICCFIEGDESAVEILSALVNRLGATSVTMNPDGKALYHAAAVMASNYVTALMAGALELTHQAGIEPAIAQRALGTLMQTAASNAAAMPLPDALTGPIARGDVGTVKKHVAAMGDCHENLQNLYCAAGLQALELALSKGTIDDACAAELRTVLTTQRLHK